MAQITICPKPCGCCGDTYHNTETECCVDGEPVAKPVCQYCVEYVDTGDCTCKPYPCPQGFAVCGETCCQAGFVCGIDCTCIPEGPGN